MFSYSIVIFVYLLILQVVVALTNVKSISILSFIMVLATSVIFTKLVYALPKRGRSVISIIFIIFAFFLSLGNVFYFYIKSEFYTISQLSLLDELAGVGDSVSGYLKPLYGLFLIIPILAIIGTLIVLKRDGKLISLKVTLAGIGLLLIANIGFYIQDPLLFTTVYSPVDYAREFGFISFYAREITPFTKLDAENQVYDNRVNQMPNDDYTGLFESKKNVVYITAESFDDIAIDKTLTPTLYKMANDGIFFENYYTLSTNTNVSEFSSLTSVHPPVDNTHLEDFGGNYNSLPELFNNAGYCTFGYHYNSGSFYNRENLYPELYHFTESYFSDTLDPGTPISKARDEKLFELSQQSIEQQDCNKNFTYYMSVYGHSGYNIDNRPQEQETYEYVESIYPDNDKYLNAYLTYQMSLDQMLEEMIDYYDQKGELEDTLFVVVGDHYPYALGDQNHTQGEASSSYIEQSFSGDSFETYNVPFLIYDPASKLENNQEYISNVDIMPTIADLMNFEYEYAEGKSAFDPTKESVIKWYGTNNFSVLSKDISYDGSDNTQNLTTEQEVELNQDKQYAAWLYSLFDTK